MQKYHILLEKKAFRYLKKLSKDTRNRIIETLISYKTKASPLDSTSKNCEDIKTTTDLE